MSLRTDPALEFLLRVKDKNDIDEEQHQMHGPLQDVGSPSGG